MDKELKILEQIQNNSHVNQRDLASVTKASLGMTNAILKRFAEKGLITIKKINNRNIRYFLTSEGLAELNQRSWGYFKRTIKSVVDYQDVLKKIIIQAKINGYKGVVLVGKSDLEFMVEHVCFKLDIPFLLEKHDAKNNSEFFYIFAEQWNYSTESIDGGKSNVFSLNRLVKS